MKKIREIKAATLNPKEFIDEKVAQLRETVGNGLAIQCPFRRRGFLGGHRAWAPCARETAQDLFHQQRHHARKRACQGLCRVRTLGIPIEVVDRQEDSSAPSGDLRPRGETRGHHADLLQEGFRETRGGERGQIPAPGHHPDRCGRDRRGASSGSTRLRTVGHRSGEGVRYRIFLEPSPPTPKRRRSKIGRAWSAESVFKPIPFPGPALAAA